MRDVGRTDWEHPSLLQLWSDAGWPARAERFNRRPFGAILERRAELGRFLVALVDGAGLA